MYHRARWQYMDLHITATDRADDPGVAPRIRIAVEEHPVPHGKVNFKNIARFEYATHAPPPWMARHCPGKVSCNFLCCELVNAISNINDSWHP
jgi:hypothetical protein